MSYAERAILLGQSKAAWRLGRGSPAPWELMPGAGGLDLMIKAVKVLCRRIEDHQKFVFVASEPAGLLLLTIGKALHPMGYAIIKTLDEGGGTGGGGHYRMNVTADTFRDGQDVIPRRRIERFHKRAASKVVVGVYRATDDLPEPRQVRLAGRVVHRGPPLPNPPHEQVQRLASGQTVLLAVGSLRAYPEEVVREQPLRVLVAGPRPRCRGRFRRLPP